MDHDADVGGEFRLDPLVREWVAIVGGRQDRPNLPESACPFCVGGIEAPEPYDVKAFSNRWPAFTPGEPVEADPAAAAATGWARLPGRGAAEVVLYTPRHDVAMWELGTKGVRKVVDLWAERSAALLARPEVAYVLVFENRGEEVGATISHPHGQIYAFPFVPPVPAREAEVAASFGCTLCTEVQREETSQTRLVHTGPEWLAWVPFASGYPYGLLAAPRGHRQSLVDLDDRARDGLAAALVDVLARYDRLFGRPFPYMLWIHPGVHLHVHIAPPLRSETALRFVAAGEVGSGTLSNPVVPEAAARALREA